MPPVSVPSGYRLHTARGRHEKRREELSTLATFISERSRPLAGTIAAVHALPGHGYVYLESGECIEIAERKAHALASVPHGTSYSTLVREVIVEGLPGTSYVEVS